MCASRLGSPQSGGDLQPLQRLQRFTLVQGRAFSPAPYAHFLSDGGGQSQQENLLSELELGSFCVFFLTHDWSILKCVGLAWLCWGQPGYSHMLLACWGSRLCEPRPRLLLFRYFPWLYPALHHWPYVWLCSLIFNEKKKKKSSISHGIANNLSNLWVAG